MRARQHITNALAGGAMCTFIDDLGRPRLAYPTSPGARAVKACTAQRPKRTKVTLEVDAAAEPIAGELRDTQGVRRGFAGWLGLLAALERAFAGGRGERAHHRPSSESTSASDSELTLSALSPRSRSTRALTRDRKK